MFTKITKLQSIQKATFQTAKCISFVYQMSKATVLIHETVIKMYRSGDN